MAQQTIIIRTDDLDGTELGREGESVSFSLDGHEYEIDLSEKNAATMRDALGMYVQHARRLTKSAGRGRRSSGTGRGTTDRDRTKQIREWAKAHGYDLAERGRIPANIVEDFERGTPNPQGGDTLAAQGRALAAKFVDDKGNPVNPEEQTTMETPKKQQGKATSKAAAKSDAGPADLAALLP